MAVQPIVEYYRLVDDGTGAAYNFVNPSSPTAATLLDFGTVDAGQDTYEQNIANITTANNGCQVYAIYNNRGDGTNATSTMQNTILSVVNNEDGHQGNSDGDVYTGKWINVVLNDHSEVTETVQLGKGETDGVPDKTETKLQLTALGINEQTNAGEISGAANGGTLTGEDTKNFARIKIWVHPELNAVAGPHKFRLRTTYSYT